MNSRKEQRRLSSSRACAMEPLEARCLLSSTTPDFVPSSADAANALRPIAVAEFGSAATGISTASTASPVGLSPSISQAIASWVRSLADEVLQQIPPATTAAVPADVSATTDPLGPSVAGQIAPPALHAQWSQARPGAPVSQAWMLAALERLAASASVVLVGGAPISVREFGDSTPGASAAVSQSAGLASPIGSTGEGLVMLFTIGQRGSGSVNIPAPPDGAPPCASPSSIAKPDIATPDIAPPDVVRPGTLSQFRAASGADAVDQTILSTAKGAPLIGVLSVRMLGQNVQASIVFFSFSGSPSTPSQPTPGSPAKTSIEAAAVFADANALGPSALQTVPRGMDAIAVSGFESGARPDRADASRSSAAARFAVSPALAGTSAIFGSAPVIASAIAPDASSFAPGLSAHQTTAVSPAPALASESLAPTHIETIGGGGIAKWIAAGALEPASAQPDRYEFIAAPRWGAVTAAPPTPAAQYMALPLVMLAPPLVQVAGATFYQFAAFDPASTFNDALAAFAGESATPEHVAATERGHGRRAWAITAAVLTIDALLAARWLANRRAAKKKRASARRSRWHASRPPSLRLVD